MIRSIAMKWLVDSSRVAVLAGGTALICAGCNTQEVGVNLTVPVLMTASRSFRTESDIELARAAIPAQLKTLDGLLEVAPRNKDLLHLLAQSYLEYAFGFLDDELESLPPGHKDSIERQVLAQRATVFYDRSVQYSLRALDTADPHFSDSFQKGAPAIEAAAAKLKKESAPGLLFAGMALASAINVNQGDPSRLVDLPRAIALLKASHALDPDYYNGGAATTLGQIYSSQPKSSGGDPKQAKKWFDEGIAKSQGKFLLGRVQLARAYAVSIKDRALFEKTLKGVLDEKPDVLPEYRLANELAKRRAARYLAQAKELF